MILSNLLQFVCALTVNSVGFVALAFLNYYDAIAFGLKKTSPLLKLGGPGGACKDDVTPTSYCWALLDHVQNGVNYFTGRKDVPLDFISVHKKVYTLSFCEHLYVL